MLPWGGGGTPRTAASVEFVVGSGDGTTAVIAVPVRFPRVP
ncbi:hypothetical protein ACWGAN_31260 [Streptomyces sp. NPDC054945]